MVRALPDARGCGADVDDACVGLVDGNIAHAPTDHGRSDLAPFEERDRAEAFLDSVVLRVYGGPKGENEGRSAEAQRSTRYLHGSIPQD